MSTKLGLPDIYPINDENERLNKRKDAIKKSQQYLLDQQNIRQQQKRYVEIAQRFKTVPTLPDAP